MTGAICDGGSVEWGARVYECIRCWRRCTHWIRSQAWYDPDVVCGHCGALNGREIRSPRLARLRAAQWRAGFVAWLLAGSPPCMRTRDAGRKR